MSEFFPENSVASRVFDAFSTIEATDRRVTKLVMPKKTYDIIRQELCFNTNVISSDEFVVYSTLEPHRNVTLDGNISGFDTRCSLWGARIIIADQFRAYAADETPMSVAIPYHAFIGNLTIHVKSRAIRCHFRGTAEQRALDTLREMVSESDFRKYLKYGFISTSGKSGKVYQISRNGSHIKVWDQGQLVEEICVRIADSRIPLTDNIIACKIALEADEEGFKRSGNIYNMRKVA